MDIRKDESTPKKIKFRKEKIPHLKEHTSNSDEKRYYKSEKGGQNIKHF